MLSIKWKMVTGCLLSIQNRCSKNNISHAQRLISQYTIILITECLIFVSNHLIFVSTFIDLILLLALNCTENKLFLIVLRASGLKATSAEA